MVQRTINLSMHVRWILRWIVERIAPRRSPLAPRTRPLRSHCSQRVDGRHATQLTARFPDLRPRAHGSDPSTGPASPSLRADAEPASTPRSPPAAASDPIRRWPHDLFAAVDCHGGAVLSVLKCASCPCHPLGSDRPRRTLPLWWFVGRAKASDVLPRTNRVMCTSPPEADGVRIARQRSKGRVQRLGPGRRRNDRSRAP